MVMGLKGRVAVITGPAKGMGAAVTLAFAAAGCRLALLGRDTAAIAPVADEARRIGVEAIVIASTSPTARPARRRSGIRARRSAGGSIFS